MGRLTLVDAHLIGVPGLGTLTVRRLTGGDLQVLGGQADGALDAELLVLGAVDELLAHLLERLDIARGEGDSDLVDLGALAELALLWLVVGHGVWMGWECGGVIRAEEISVTTWILDRGNVMTGGLVLRNFFVSPWDIRKMISVGGSESWHASPSSGLAPSRPRFPKR